MEPGSSKIEKMLGVTFASDPRRSRFPLPEIPAEYAEAYPGEPYVIPFEVTPEIARDWLTYRVISREVTPKELLHDEFGPNRRFIPGALTGSSSKKGWIDTFKDGEIRKTHQGIAFTPDGFLLDGQHRLAACLLTKISYRPLLANGVPWDGFVAMDSGRARTADQFITMPHPTLCAAAARYIMPSLKGVEDREYYDKLAPKQDVIDMVYGWPLFSGPWMNEIMAAAKGSNIPNTPLAATVLMALAAGGDAVSDHVQQFLNGLKKGFQPYDYIKIGGTGQDPRWVLSSAFRTSRTEGKRTFSSKETYGNVGLIRRAMNIWMDQEVAGVFQRTHPGRDLPPVWNVDAVRAYHTKHVR